MRFWIPSVFALSLFLGTSAQQCGRQAGNALCANRLCCSRHGWCGSTSEYCTDNCQSQCGGGATPTPSNPAPSTGGGGGDVSSLISSSLFDQMLRYRNDARCPSNGFYTCNAFISAARSFNGFGTTGDVNTRRRELAAFLAQTSHETTGGWAQAPDGPYARVIASLEKETHRVPTVLPMNGHALLVDSIMGEGQSNSLNLVATDSTISYRTAIWFWMTPQAKKPSSHDVIIRRWTPSAADRSAGRVSGYGVITNIINGGRECGGGANDLVASRIGFYKRYCDIFGVSYGDNLDCYNQRPFA